MSAAHLPAEPLQVSRAPDAGNREVEAVSVKAIGAADETLKIRRGVDVDRTVLKQDLFNLIQPRFYHPLCAGIVW